MDLPSADDPEECDVCHCRIWQCLKHDLQPGSARGCEYCGYEFQGVRYLDPSELAEALGASWIAAIDALEKQSPEEMVRDNLGDELLAGKLKKVRGDRAMNPAQKLCVTLLALNSKRPVMWRDQELNFALVQAEPELAVAVMDSTTPAWIFEFAGDSTLARVQSRWNRRLACARKAGLSPVVSAATSILLAEPDVIRIAAEKLRGDFGGASDAKIAAILKSKPQDDSDATLLLADKKLFKTHAELWAERRDSYLSELRTIATETASAPVTRKSLNEVRRAIVVIETAHQSGAHGQHGDTEFTEVLRQVHAVHRARSSAHAEAENRWEGIRKMVENGEMERARGLVRMLPRGQFPDVESSDAALLLRRYLTVKRIGWSTVTIIVVAILGFAARSKIAERGGEAFTVLLADGVSLKFLPVPTGRAILGSPDSDQSADPDERPQTTVIISSRYWLSETEITQGQWRAVMATTFETQRTLNNGTGATSGDMLPMVFVSWNDAEVFCRKLQPLLDRVGIKGAVRLPTEVEWEYACRGGAPTRFSFGDEFLPESGNFGAGLDSPGRPAKPVKSYPPNAWGFFEMHGNVGEWVLGGPARYPGGTVRQWFAPEIEAVRLYRGGSSYQEPLLARSAQRNQRALGSAAAHIGFRLAWFPLDAQPHSNAPP